MLSKKSMVLSDLDGSNKRAVLTLEKTDDDVHGSIRFYNFPIHIEGILTLGFYVNNKVIKSGLTYKSTSYYTFLLNEDFINEKFSCAVLNFNDAEAKPILYGSSEGRDEDVYASIVENLSSDFSMKNVERVLDEHGIDYDEQEKQEIENEIDKCMADCKNCYYKKQFYANGANNESEEKVENKKNTVALKVEEQSGRKTLQQENNEEKDDESDNNLEKDEEEIFVKRLKPQIDKLFEKNPIESNLEEMIPSSKWVRVEYEDDGDFYVFGLIYEGDEIKYVCYGVPAVYEKEPPKELSGYPIFLPLNSEDKEGFGYWLTYQDAETGEPIKAVVE